MKPIIDLLTYGEAEGDKKRGYRLAPTWMFLAEFILGSGLVFLSGIAHSYGDKTWVIGLIMGMPLVYLGGGAFILRVKQWEESHD